MKLSLMYHNWKGITQRAMKIDYIGSRFWIVREYGVSENCAKYMVAMFVKWLYVGV